MYALTGSLVAKTTFDTKSFRYLNQKTKREGDRDYEREEVVLGTRDKRNYKNFDVQFDLFKDGYF